MILKEILNNIVEKQRSILLCDSSSSFKAEELLSNLRSAEGFEPTVVSVKSDWI